MIVTEVLLCFCLIVVVVSRLVRGKGVVMTGHGKGAKKAARSPVIVRFSLVAMAATLLVALWSFRTDLGLVRSRANDPVAEVNHHAP
jgi:hypothetical protein